jgi:hypothetical protein
MKIFWSWQSDTPGKTGRHFVRDALEAAIEELKSAKDVLDESDRPQSEGLHLDHDRKNLVGSPDLFLAIHAKIQQSTVFVGDITPVATTTAGKKVMNPNVAIELGIALESVGSDSILFIMNKAYGDHAAMPFNLAHKSGPIMYELPEDASGAQIKAEHKKLVTILTDCISPYVQAAKPKPMPFDIGDDWQGKSSFVNGATMTIVDTHMGGIPKVVKLRTDARMFLRVFPKFPISKRTVEQLQALSTDGTFRVLYFDQSMDWGRTPDGFIKYAVLNGDDLCPDYVKVFQTGEIWAVLHYELFEPPTILLEVLLNRFALRLDDYSEYLSKKWEYDGDIGFVAGITGIKEKQVTALKYGSILAKMGLGMLPQVVVHGGKTAKQTAVEALQPFATEAWQAFGLPPRPLKPD